MKEETSPLNKTENLVQKIESIFNFDQELVIDENIKKSPVTIEDSISAFEGKSNQLLNISQSEIQTLEDKEYIDTAFKTMIDCGLDGLKVITKTIKIGISGKDLEGYARWADSVSMTIERLVNYKMKIRDIQLMNNPDLMTPQKTETPNLVMTGKELNNFINEAKKNSQLNGIEATFEVLEGEFREKKKE